MNLQLTGKRALITGGSRGIGRAIAEKLSQEGVDCVICSRTESTLRQSAQEIEQKSGHRVIPIAANMADVHSIKKLVYQASEVLGGIDILINCGARVSGGVPEDFEHITDELILQDFNEKFLGAFRCAREVVPYMKERSWGRIINISGLAAREAGSISAGARNVSVVHLTKTLAMELGRYGINVNAIYPGLTETETIVTRFLVGEKSEADVQQMLLEAGKQNSIGRLVTAEEVANVALFLASPLSVAITGEVMAATGGKGNAVYY